MPKQSDGAAPSNNNHEPLLSEAEIKSAHDWMATIQSKPIFPAIRLRNAIQAYLRDVDRAQRANPPVKLLAIDTSEVMAYAEYAKPHSAAFSFQGLLVNNARRDQYEGRLESLDRLVNHHLVREMDGGHLLLDGHADEIALIRHRLDKASAAETVRLFPFIPTELTAFSVKQLTNIEVWLKNQRGTNQQVEFERFRENFLPNWRDEMFTRLVDAKRSTSRMQEYISSSNYCFVRPTSFGDRSIMKALSLRGITFEWKSFEAYASRPATATRFAEAETAISSLMRLFQRHRRPADTFSNAIKRDACSLAQLDMINRFLIENRVNARIELVSRSPSLHSALAALPDGRLHATLRHPLFVPEIYSFDAASLSALGEVFQRVDSIIAPYLAASEQGRTSDAPLSGRFGDEITEISVAARELLPLLEDVLSIKQSHDAIDRGRFYREVTGHLIRNNPNAFRTMRASEGAYAEKIEALFGLVLDKLRARQETLSERTNSALLEQVSRLVGFDRERTFGPNAKLSVRVIDFYDANHSGGVPTVEPVPFIMVRVIAGGMRRVFHIHSKRVRDYLLQDAPAVVASTVENVLQPRQYEIDISKIFNNLDFAMKCLASSHPQLQDRSDVDDWAYNIDSVFMVCLAFASHEKLDTAIAVCSLVLHRAAEILRAAGHVDVCAPDAVKASLAYREMFLLRHYCERKLAFDDFFATKRRLADSKGSVARNLARAQRDLEFAGSMSRRVEGCFDVPGHSRQELFNDFRLPIATWGGWIDQLLMLSKEMGSAWDLSQDQHRLNLEEVRRRLDIWTATNVAHELVAIGRRARQIGEYPSSNDAISRYMAHVEARALQGALSIFVIFLAFPISPEMHRLWRIEPGLGPERTLVFHRWGEWWERYSDLTQRYQFDMSIGRVFKPVMDTLCRLANMRSQIANGADAAPLEAAALGEVTSLDVSLRQLIGDGNNVGQFQRVLAEALIERLQELASSQALR